MPVSLQVRSGFGGFSIFARGLALGLGDWRGGIGDLGIVPLVLCPRIIIPLVARRRKKNHIYSSCVSILFGGVESSRWLQLLE